MKENKRNPCSFKDRVSNFYKRNKFPITVEPLLFFLSMAFGLSEVIFNLSRTNNPENNLQVIRSQLILDKMCQNKLNYSSEICENLTSYEDIQTEVQKQVSDYEATYRSITFAPK